MEEMRKAKRGKRSIAELLKEISEDDLYKEMDEIIEERIRSKEALNWAISKLLLKYKKSDELKYFIVKRRRLGSSLDKIITKLRKSPKYKFVKKAEVEKKWDEFLADFEKEVFEGEMEEVNYIERGAKLVEEL